MAPFQRANLASFNAVLGTSLLRHINPKSRRVAIVTMTLLNSLQRLSWSSLKRQTCYWTVLTDLWNRPTSLLASQWLKYAEINCKRKEKGWDCWFCFLDARNLNPEETDSLSILLFHSANSMSRSLDFGRLSLSIKSDFTQVKWKLSLAIHFWSSLLLDPTALSQRYWYILEIFPQYFLLFY